MTRSLCAAVAALLSVTTAPATRAADAVAVIADGRLILIMPSADARRAVRTRSTLVIASPGVVIVQGDRLRSKRNVFVSRERFTTGPVGPFTTGAIGPFTTSPVFRPAAKRGSSTRR